MMHALAEAAASNGHTYMSWEALQKQSLKLLRDSGILVCHQCQNFSFPIE